MQKSISENQSADGSEGRFTNTHFTKTTDYSKNQNCFPRGKFNHFQIVLAFAISFFHGIYDFTGDMKFIIQAKPYFVP